MVDLLTDPNRTYNILVKYPENLPVKDESF